MIPVQKPSIGNEELAAIKEVFDSAWLGKGTQTDQFEKQLSARLGGLSVIATNTGTSALHLALDALRLTKHDEVILPSMTFAATVQAVLAVGAIPVFCDVREHDLNMDPADLESKITENTKVIIPVHYGGQPCQMDRIVAIADNAMIMVVEDAAHAFGSRYHGAPIGTIGDFTCFSFDPIKNITCGEGGAVVVKNEYFANRVRTTGNLGISEQDKFDGAVKLSKISCFGFRYHMSNLNAAIGLVQLNRFPTLNGQKKHLVRRYDNLLENVPFLSLLSHSEEAAPFFYVVRCMGDRDKFVKHLHNNGISCGIHYYPNHLQPFVERYAKECKLPVTERVAKEIVTLPMYADLTDQEADCVIDTIRRFNG